MLAFCLITIYQGFVIYPILSEVSSSSLSISMGWVILSIPVGGLLMSVYILEALIQSIYHKFKADRSGEKFVC
jgi:TRAP-type C4-dicarboxylate transport system permease small subunit